MTIEPGPLIGKGRDCDVYEAGPGRILRRDRKGRSTEVEALTLQYVADNGYPVPEVFDADGPDIVMAKIEGPTMVDAFSQQPWRLNTFAKQPIDMDLAKSQLDTALDYRRTDANLSASEVATMESTVAQALAHVR